MDVYNAILNRRSVRRFQQKNISIESLKKIINAARLAPSAANLQPLEFFIVTDKELRSKVFETLGWAGYIKPRWVPSENERPMAYIVILVRDANKNPWYVRDASIAAGYITLMAENEGLGSCIICKVDREKLHSILELPQNYYVDSVVALGYKAEHPVVEELKDSVEYWRDEREVLHVPKRKLEDIIHINRF